MNKDSTSTGYCPSCGKPSNINITFTTFEVMYSCDKCGSLIRSEYKEPKPKFER